MKCSYQIGSNLDQSKRASKLVNWMRSVFVQERCAFPARSTSDHKSYRFKKGTRDDQQSHYLLEGGDLGGYRTQVWCDTELTTNTQTREEKTATVEKFHATVDEPEVSMENWQ